MHTPKAWSYSSISLFKQCPYRYYREKVVKDIPKEPESEAILYGVAFHTAAEEYVRDDKPLPPHFSFAQQSLDTLKGYPGEKFCELKMGIAKRDGKLEACEFFDKDVWFRGVVDLLIVDRESGVAYVIDYKTGKSAKYADTLQLDLMAAATFLRFPEVKKVKAALLFVVTKEAKNHVKESYTYTERFKAFEKLNDVLHRRDMAYSTEVFNKTQHALCRAWCPVMDCHFNGRGK